MPGERYSYRVRWSAEDEGYVGTVEELPSLSLVAESPEMALAGVRDLVTAALEDMGTTGEVAPDAINDRPYAAESLMPGFPILGRPPTAAEQDVASDGPVHFINSPSDPHLGWPVESRTWLPSQIDIPTPAQPKAADSHERLHTAIEALFEASAALNNARAQLQRLAASHDT